ncbi:hypothetical protein ABBQ38_013211 [Trebouxia sp. C0009 RCD-2024]
MVAMLRGMDCPLDCDLLVFPMPVGEQWSCAVVDMRKHNITYYTSFKDDQNDEAAVVGALSIFLEQEWQIWCSADLPVFTTRAPKHTPKQTDGPGGGSGMYTLLVAEHAGRYAKPKLKRKQRDMWRTKMTVDLALKNAHWEHRQVQEYTSINIIAVSSQYISSDRDGHCSFTVKIKIGRSFKVSPRKAQRLQSNSWYTLLSKVGRRIEQAQLIQSSRVLEVSVNRARPGLQRKNIALINFTGGYSGPGDFVKDTNLVQSITKADIQTNMSPDKEVKDKKRKRSKAAASDGPQEQIMASLSKNSPLALENRMKQSKKAQKAEKRLREEKRKATLEEKGAEASLNQACVQTNGADPTMKGHRVPCQYQDSNPEARLEGQHNDIQHDQNGVKQCHNKRSGVRPAGQPAATGQPLDGSNQQPTPSDAQQGISTEPGTVTAVTTTRQLKVVTDRSCGSSRRTSEVMALTTQTRLPTEAPSRRSSDSGLSLDLWMDVQPGNSNDEDSNAELIMFAIIPTLLLYMIEFCARALPSITTGSAALLPQVVSALEVPAGAGATPGLGPPAGQAKVTAPGLAGMGQAGEQAAVGAGGEGLARQPMLPPPADAIPVDTPHTSADPAAQPAILKKRSSKHSDPDETEAEHADEKKEKKKKKKEKEEKQQQEACKSKASPSEVETEAATAAQSILEHSVSRPLSRPAEAADASGTAGCSLIADSSKASSLSQDTSQQDGLPRADAAPRQPPAANFFGKRAIPALLPVEAAPDSQIRWEVNPAFRRIGTPAAPTKKPPFPFGPGPSDTAASLAEEVKQGSSSQQTQGRLAAVPPHQEICSLERPHYKTACKGHACPEAAGACGAAKQQTAAKV